MDACNGMGKPGMRMCISEHTHTSISSYMHTLIYVYANVVCAKTCCPFDLRDNQGSC